MSKDEVLDQIGRELSEMMFYLMHSYKGIDKEVAELLTMQLAMYISVTARAPANALVTTARVIENYDFKEIRAQYFGYKTLGVDTTQPLVKPGFGKEAQVINIGEPTRRKPEND